VELEWLQVLKLPFLSEKRPVSVAGWRAWNGKQLP
jgi:hypothetical protein